MVAFAGRYDVSTVLYKSASPAASSEGQLLRQLEVISVPTLLSDCDRDVDCVRVVFRQLEDDI